jgi:RNA polymerase sigma-70 factor (ECF subfamily)
VATDRPSVFLKLFLAHEGDLRAFIGALMRERTAREDVLQDVALALWQSFDRYDKSRSFGAWARGVAANKILQYRRRDARLPMTLSPEAIQAVQDAFDRSERPGSERQEALEACLRRLPPKSAEILSLRYSHQASGTEIATQLHLSVDAVYQTLSRIRSQLAECVQLRLASQNAPSTQLPVSTEKP